MSERKETNGPQLVVDPTPVECIGGPHDGEFRRADEDGVRPNGCYVVAFWRGFDGRYRITERRYVPS